MDNVSIAMDDNKLRFKCLCILYVAIVITNSEINGNYKQTCNRVFSLHNTKCLSCSSAG